VRSHLSKKSSESIEMNTQKALQAYSTSAQKHSRNRLIQQWGCGRRILQGCEDIAIELVPDFREGLDWQRAVATRNPDGSVTVRRDRQGELSPYQAWVLSRLVALWRKHKGSEATYDKAFSIRHKLSMENFNG
jgi:hypothetical protein